MTEKKPKKKNRGSNIADYGQQKDQERAISNPNNVRYLQFMQALITEFPFKPVRERDMSVEALQERLARYLALCEHFKMKVGNKACYLALGCDQVYVDSYANNVNGMGDRHPDKRDFFRQVKALCGVYRENLMQDGQINPVTGIFWQKNYDGLRDVQNMEVSHEQVTKHNESISDIAKRYAIDVEVTDTPLKIEQYNTDTSALNDIDGSKYLGEKKILELAKKGLKE